MCLHNDPEIVKAIKASNKEVFICYKVLHKTPKLLIAPYRKTKYVAGVNKSDAKSHSTYGLKTINKGIHVHRTKKFAERFGIAKNSGNVIVKFTAFKKDLLGANKTQMVFREVTLDKEEYQKHRS